MELKADFHGYHMHLKFLLFYLGKPHMILSTLANIRYLYSNRNRPNHGILGDLEEKLSLVDYFCI